MKTIAKTDFSNDLTHLKSQLFMGVSLLIISFFISTFTWAQSGKESKINGIIKDNDGTPIYNAQIFNHQGEWLTFTDVEGVFSIPTPSDFFVINAVSFAADTVYIQEHLDLNNLEIILNTAHELRGVTILNKEQGTTFDRMSTVQQYLISSSELTKSACCNLSESFETTPAVDVGFSDGISGYKTIQLLGLSGPNTLYTRESIPDLRGLASVIGLTFTPGIWVESMQLSKGAGSVKHGFEGSAGQINVEWPKPFLASTPRLTLNVYQNSQGRSELNAIAHHALNAKTSTSLLAHYSNNWKVLDDNKDGFMDHPLGQNIILSNRWMHFGKNGWEFQAGIKGILMDQEGGSTQRSEVNSNEWKYASNIKRVETWAKVGKTYEHQPWKTMGLQLSYILHDQENNWHKNSYSGEQNSLFVNYLYQTILNNTQHQITIGGQWFSDIFKEKWMNSHFPTLHYMYIGAHAEYNYQPSDAINIQFGLRGDLDHEGIFFTPRAHLRTELWKGGIGRLSLGRAKRNVHPFTEFSSYFASNRILSMPGHEGPANQWAMEDAWNGGMSITQELPIQSRILNLSADIYYTRYTRQILADLLTPGELKFYEVSPGSDVWSSQFEVMYEPINRLTLKGSYRFQHINVPYESGKTLAYLHAPHKGFLNAEYMTHNGWSFDGTWHIIGKQKVPYHPSLPAGILAKGRAPVQHLFNAQISKSWKKANIEWYLGVENLTNQMQQSVVLNHEDINDPLLDASLIYASPMGRVFYTGIRFKL